MGKTKQIWHRFNNDQKQLKTDCVDLVSKCYLLLGQKPETQQVVIMAQLLYDDLINRYGSLTMEEVSFIFEQGIRNSNNGGFLNVRNFNLWIKEYRQKAQEDNQKGLITDYQRYQANVKRISNTINKAKQIK
tara:strand:+ start:4644 stop:5039 length:396 start_codon:yes stop_codon:yes gene_type:complete